RAEVVGVVRPYGPLPRGLGAPVRRPGRGRVVGRVRGVRVAVEHVVGRDVHDARAGAGRGAREVRRADGVDRERGRLVLLGRVDRGVRGAVDDDVDVTDPGVDRGRVTQVERVPVERDDVVVVGQRGDDVAAEHPGGTRDQPAHPPPPRHTLAAVPARAARPYAGGRAPGRPGARRRRRWDVQLRELAIEGAWEVTPPRFTDDRGVFVPWFVATELARVTGHDLDLRQANMSVSAAGVVRGIHLADVPPGQAKHVACPRRARPDDAVTNR